MRKVFEKYFCDLCEKSEEKGMKSVSLNSHKMDLCSTCYSMINMFYWKRDIARESNINNV